MSYLPAAEGLGLGYRREPALSGTPDEIGEFHYTYARDLLVGVAGLNAPVAEVADWTDWTVTPSWTDSAEGVLGDLDGGTVRVELWNVLGAGSTDVDLTGSVLLLPYR